MDDDIHKSSIITGLQNILSSSQYSDMIIRSGSEEFKVHRAIICPRSKFFAAACNGLFQEGETGVIMLQDDDTPTLRRMLKYLYTLDYDDDGEAASVANCIHGNDASANVQATTVTEEEHLSAYQPPHCHKLLNNIAVYTIADKYDIPELEVLATKKFERVLRWSDIYEDLASLSAIVDAVFDTTPDTKCELRNVVIQYCKSYKGGIIDNEETVAIVRDHERIGLAMTCQIFHKWHNKESSMKAQIERAIGGVNTLMLDMERISRTTKCMKVSDLRELQPIYFDAQHQRLRDLRDAIQEAKDRFIRV